jgi:hypothetical protein
VVEVLATPPVAAPPAVVVEVLATPPVAAPPVVGADELTLLAPPVAFALPPVGAAVLEAPPVAALLPPVAPLPPVAVLAPPVVTALLALLLSLPQAVPQRLAKTATPKIRDLEIQESFIAYLL